MAKMWEPQPIEVYKNWIDTIIDEAQDDLTKWEENFVKSLSIWLKNSRNLSERQAEILERIYAEKTN